MSNLSKAVKAFNDAVYRFDAVIDVVTGREYLDQVPTTNYSIPGEFGDLPHTLLRRTGGGFKGEVWANTTFTLTRDARGWLTLEFIAWWVRYRSQQGDNIQMRPSAFEPYHIEFGDKLKFIIDHFFTREADCEVEEADSVLFVLMTRRANQLSLSIDEHASVLKGLVRE